MDLDTWTPQSSDMNLWPDRWWHSANFAYAVQSGHIAQVSICKENGSDAYTFNDLTAEHVVKKMQTFPKGHKFARDIRKLKITSFTAAMEHMSDKYKRMYEAFLEVTKTLYLLNCGDPRAEQEVIRNKSGIDTLYDPNGDGTIVWQSMQAKRAKIEETLKRRAEIEDAVLIQREKQREKQEELKAREKERAVLISQYRVKQAEQKDRILQARDTELAKRKNVNACKIITPYASPSRPTAIKISNIECARQHAHAMQEKEKQRVCQLEKMMQIVEIGDAIQRGDS